METFGGLPSYIWAVLVRLWEGPVILSLGLAIAFSLAIGSLWITILERRDRNRDGNR